MNRIIHRGEQAVYIITVVVGLLLLLPINISAQEEEEARGRMLEEVIVTAQKREQSIQDVGISIIAFTGEQLRAFGATESVDIINLTAGLQGPNSGGNFTQSYSIRGLSQADFGQSHEAPVALHVDEVYVASQGMGRFLAFDIERVEVLRGPQGTLFGRNATGGVVHFISRKPTRELEGYADFTYGSYDQIKAEGAISGPLTKNLAARLSFTADIHDPYVNNRIGPDAADSDKKAGRFQLLFNPNDDFEALLNVHGAVKRNAMDGWYDHSSAKPTDIGGGGVPLPPTEDFFGTCPGCDALGFIEPGNDVFDIASDANGFHDDDIWGVTGKLTWNFGNFTLTSITDYSDFKTDYVEESDMQPGEFFHFFGLGDVEQFSEELRINGETERMRWVAGFYYLDIDGEYQQGGFLTDLGFGVGTQDTDYTLNTQSWSLFTQAEYDLSDQFTIIAGVRYINEDKDTDYISAFRDVRFGTPIGFGSTPILYAFQGESSADLYTVRAELDWRPSDDLLLYFSFNRGIKAGSFNGPLDPSGSPIFIDPVTFDPAPTADAAMEYDEEVLYAYEIGFKSTLFDGRARLNVAAFYYDYQDYQAFNLVGLTSFIQNADAELFGVDAELFASPFEGLDVSFGASYLDQEVFDVPLGGIFVDREIPWAPKWNVTGMARYEWPMAGGRMAVQGNFNYNSDYFLGLNNSAVLKEEAYVVANARLSYATLDDRWEAAVFVKNLSDTEYRGVAFDLAGVFGSVENLYAPPRWVGGTIRYQWN